MSLQDPNQGSGESNDIDSIMSSVEPVGREIAMSSPESEPAQSSPPQREEFELDWKGQKIKADREKFTKWAQMGYDYNQNISAFKNEKDGFLKEKSEWEKQYSPYKEIDQYAKENQEWWNHVQQSYDQRAQQQQVQSQIPDELKSYLEPIVNDYSQVKNFIQEHQRGIIEKQSKEQDAQLETEIKSISTKYNLDFSSKDDSGQSLEAKVLNHARENGIPTFKAAFLDYYHDNLEKIAEARGKESVMAEMKKKRELGLLGESSTPSRLSKISEGSSKGQSWHDLQKDIYKELNI